jgi:glycosyltransferase involved in cell wall biosynthesis
MAEHCAIKVTIVGLNYAPERSGIAAFTTAVCEGLAESGLVVRAITGYPHYPPLHRYEGYEKKLPVERHNGVLITRVRHFVGSSRRPANRFIMELTFGLGSSFAHWYRPDVSILVSPGWLSSAIASIRTRLFGIPTCVWVQEVDGLDVPRPRRGGSEGPALGRIARFCLLPATTIVVGHERLERRLVDELGIPSDRIEIVRNWSTVPPVSGRPRQEVRAELDWMPDDVVVLNSGGSVSHRELETVIQASERAVDRGSKIRFVLLRQGEPERVNDRLDYRPLPAATSLMETLAAADVLFLSERPGQNRLSVPSELTTYFTTGLPVIAATDDSSLVADEIALSGGGIRIDPADPDSLLKVAEELASAPVLAAALGESGRKFAATFLSPEPAIAAFVKIIDGSIGSKARRAVQ